MSYTQEKEMHLVIDGNDFDNSIVSYNIEVGYPALLSGNPDSRYELLPDEIEILAVRLQVADNVYAVLDSDYYHLISEQVEEQHNASLNVDGF